jgi:hypothetical protein
MKISIDTAADSTADILKAIKLLQSLVEHHQESRDMFSSSNTDIFASTPSPAPAPAENPVAAFGNMFGDGAPAPATQVVQQKDDDDVPKIELY